MASPHAAGVAALIVSRFGAPDAAHRDPAQYAAWLREALDSLQAGEAPARPETKPVGCSVKWKSR